MLRTIALVVGMGIAIYTHHYNLHNVTAAALVENTALIEYLEEELRNER